ncbi:MAG: preprotein translocase subunit SecE [Myxococcota bacterium]|nr:preprotein translocase subunit SecE [Myxococcota bacterium]
MTTHTRYIYVVFLVTAALMGWALASAAEAVLLNMDGVEDFAVAGLLPLSTIIGGVGAIVSMFALLKNVRAVTYTNEVIGELVKVTWPTREETTNNSIVVIVVTVIFSGSLAIYDWVWAQVTERFLFGLS